MKKIVNIFTLCLLVIFTFTAVASAGTLKDEKDNKIVVNEYIHFKELKSKSDSYLKSKGFSENEIKEIRNLDYAAELYKRSKLDDNALRAMGYDENKIMMLKNFSGTEIEMIALSATCDVQGYRSQYYYNSGNNTTYFKVGFSWNWSQRPVWTYRDIIAFSWTEGMYADVSTGASYCDLTYIDDSLNEHWGSATIQVGTPGVGCYARFPMLSSGNWCKKGQGIMAVSKIGRIPQCAMKVSYGHNNLSVTPNVSFPYGGGISFSYSVTEEDYAYIEAVL